MINGILGTKLGMTQLFDDNGIVQAVSLIEAGPVTITQIKTRANDGYEAVQVGFQVARKLKKPEEGHLKNLGKFRVLREFKAVDPAGVQLGQTIDVSIFKPGDTVDVIGTSKGRGFAGVVKRHHFKGGPKTHGQSDRLRRGGSIGATTSPGHVLKGLRMAGHLGNEQVTVHNLEVARVDTEKNLLVLNGAVPGHRQALLMIRKAIKPKKRAES